MQTTPKRHGLAKPADIMQYTGLSKTTVYALIASGELPAIRIGRSVRVKWEDLETYIESRRIVADPE